jgi:ubiquinone biosynthesis protein UbiJ
MISVIYQALLLKLTNVINNTLQEAASLDSNLLVKLNRLDKKSIKIIFKLFPVDLVCRVNFIDSKISINNHHADKTGDLNITLMPGSLIRAKVLGVEQVIRNRDIELSGDLHLAMDLQSIFNNTEFNYKDRLQQKITEITSDSFAWQFMNVLEKILERINLKHAELYEQITDYVQIEQEILVNKFIIDDFISEVDKIRDDVERLAVRVARLQ